MYADFQVIKDACRSFQTDSWYGGIGGLSMRYHTVRKYPVTQAKKYNQKKEQEQEHFLDISLGTAAGLLALVFAEGVFWGYMIKKLRK